MQTQSRKWDNNQMEEEIITDIIEWDSVNWAKFLDFIDDADMDFQGKRVLALGERNGGMSLFFALRGAEVLCSDLDGPTDEAPVLHEKYGVRSKIKYAAIDAVHIPSEYDGQFDVVTFKSVLGGIGRNNNYHAQEQCVASIYRVLKKDGLCIFADNMRGSFLHMALRQRFVSWGGTWHYETDKEITSLFHQFRLIDTRKFGVVGTFGRSEWQRRLLGKFDTVVFDKILPDTSKYIGAYIFQKCE